MTELSSCLDLGSKRKTSDLNLKLKANATEKDLGLQSVLIFLMTQETLLSMPSVYKRR